MPLSTKSQDSTISRCVWGAIMCVVVGGIATVAVPQAVGYLSLALEPNEGALLAVIEPLLVILQWSLFPLGASLIGASVVIHWLRKHAKRVPSA